MVTARAVAETVTDPELPMLTLADLGVLREVSETDGRVSVTITPTYTGCPAMDTMRDDLEHALRDAGYAEIDISVTLSPAWTSDWISADGLRKLADAGIAPPARAPRPASGPIPLSLGPSVRRVRCPHCQSANTEELSRFGATVCRALYRCRDCCEPFEHVKEI
ncbi:MAG TPA: 1,2-phenylacetyl-CoA epoxidase subunit PaaD [Pseudonocardiaceae bacterium]|nr:1,2-phenylacetyl-CoA epoxidase subunit PaaD [Pseudonocardiaceae bacterium]